jgi:hypothetical protein
MVVREVEFFGDYTLRYNWNAFEKLAVALGAPAFSDFDKIMAKLGPTEIRIIIWAGILHKFPNIKKEQVSDIIDEYMETSDINTLTDLVMTALTEASVFGRKSDKGETAGSKSKPSKS